MAILSRFSEHDVRFLAARTQQLALTGHKRSVRSSRALGVLVVVVSFGVVGGEFAGVDLNRLALPLGVVLFASGSPGEISPFRHLASVRHRFDDDASLFNTLAVGMVPAYLFAKADLGGSMTEASIDLQQPTFRRRIRLHR
jgi:hypothetical protein